MSRVLRVCFVCFVSVFFLSGQQSGFKVKPSQTGPNATQTLASVQGIPSVITRFAGCPPSTSFAYWQGNNPPTLEDQTLLNLINNDRTSVGKSKLAWHTGLAGAAVSHLKNDIPYLGDPIPCIRLGGSTIHSDLTVKDACPFPGTVHTLPQTFVTMGALECNPWNIQGRLQQALPKITFKDLGIIIAREQSTIGLGNATSFFFGAIVSNPYARNIIRNGKFTTFGCSFDDDPALRTRLLILGQGVSP